MASASNLMAKQTTSKDFAADIAGSTQNLDGATKGVDLDSFDPRALLSYVTTKQVKVNVWQLGLAFSICKLALFGYVCYAILSASQWSATTPVANTINAWVSGGASSSVSEASAVYCNNATYDYDYGGGWVYYNPVCRSHSASSVSVKGPGQLFITTMYTETASKGWACDAPEAAQNQAACTGTFTEVGLQCSCVTETAVYPLGVELMTVTFRHTFTIEELSPPLKGDSNLVAPDALGTVPLDTFFRNPATGARTFTSGSPIVFTLRELLTLAGNLSLDVPNTKEPRDARSGINRFPMMRTTGVLLTVDLEYSNRHPISGKPDITLTSVRADATVTPADGWAGLGALPTIYETIQTNYTYSNLVRYRQGVVVNFQARGSYFYFDVITLVTALITASVLLGSATVITDIIAKNLCKSHIAETSIDAHKKPPSPRDPFV